MMIELIFITCLQVTPEHCRDRSLLFTDITVETCTTQSQPVLARWVSDHPDWEVRRWACRAHDPQEARL